MIYDHHLRDGDFISLITFESSVKTIFSRVEKGNSADDTKLREFIFSPAFTSCSGCTAFFDALGTSWKEFKPSPDEEQWIIALTDGEDNRSKDFNVDSLCAIGTENSANLVCVFVSENSSNSKYASTLSRMCSCTENGLLICANPNTSASAAGGITGAFKHIAQLLSSKVMWMDIRDGLLAVSDNTGRVVACSIEGNPIWQQKSEGTCGWMVRSDF